MPSIFFLSLMNGASWGGSEELWYRTALYVAKKGWKVGCAIYYWPQKEERIRELQNAGCNIYWLPNKGRLKENFFQKLQYKLTKFKLKRCIASLPVDDYTMVVINQGGFEACTPLWKNFYKRVRTYALLFHNYNEDETFSSPKTTVLKNWTNNATYNLFAAERIQKVLEKRLGSPIPNAGMLINPITIAQPEQITVCPSLGNEPVVFVMMAALDADRKAQDNLIRALSFPKWKKRDFVLYLYGDGKSKKFLHSLIHQVGLESKVFLQGHTEDVKSALEQAHLVLQITHMDAMPISVVEAMAMGRPLVVSNIGDMPLWVQENENGWVSKNASVEEINKVLERAWSERNNWSEMGKKSFSVFKERYPPSPEQYFLNQLTA